MSVLESLKLRILKNSITEYNYVIVLQYAISTAKTVKHDDYYKVKIMNLLLIWNAANFY
jgi:hypothetical protein